MNKKIHISDLCTELEEELYEELEITNMTDLRPSKSNIEKLVSEKIRKQGKTPKRRRFKALKVFLAAAVICLFATTAFAAAGGLTYFKSIFGDSTEHVKSEITAPMVSAENASQRFSLEGMLTDGYTIDLILSLEDISGKGLPSYCYDETKQLFDVLLERKPDTGDEFSFSINYTMLPEFRTENKVVYHLTASSLDACYGADLKISFRAENSELGFTVPVDGSTASRRYTVNDTWDGTYNLETVQISPLGVLLIGREAQASGGLPTPVVSVKFKDGTIEEMMSELSFDTDGDGGTVIGGGGVVISNDPLSGPLVISTYGMRNPEGKVVTKGEFSRFINLEDVMSILVNGKEYTSLSDLPVGRYRSLSPVSGTF